MQRSWSRSGTDDEVLPIICASLPLIVSRICGVLRICSHQSSSCLSGASGEQGDQANDSADNNSADKPVKMAELPLEDAALRFTIESTLWCSARHNDRGSASLKIARSAISMVGSIASKLVSELNQNVDMLSSWRSLRQSARDRRNHQ